MNVFFYGLDNVPQVKLPSYFQLFPFLAKHIKPPMNMKTEKRKKEKIDQMRGLIFMTQDISLNLLTSSHSKIEHGLWWYRAFPSYCFYIHFD